MIKTVLIPDVHGRQFWKDALEYIENGIHTIFLGDYHDPYLHENITPKMSRDNFKEILDIANSHENVDLMLGNHDCTYYYPDESICHCRTDERNFNDVVQLFRSYNKKYKFVIKQDDFLFSHAGLHPEWVKLILNEYKIDSNNLLAWINSLVDETHHNILKVLSDVSHYRGGWTKAGSCVWSDIREYQDVDINYKQIVGHTMCSKPVIIGNTVDIDCQRCFYIDENNHLVDLKTNKIIN